MIIAGIVFSFLNELQALGEGPWMLALGLALGTYLSEDLSCIAGGLLAATGDLSFPVACTACAAGIWTGDILVYLLGMLGAKGALKWQWLARRMRPDRMARGARFFEKYGSAWIFLTRFIPGSRVISYLAAGAIGWSFKKFAVVLGVAACVWTPLLCGAAMLAGNVVERWLVIYSQYTLWILLGTGLLVWLLLKIVLPMLSWRGRRMLYGRWLRWTHWEFWPSWLIYFPVGCYIILLAMRYRCLTLFTASSPAIPHSGFAMDSKGDILDLFPRNEMLPAYLRIPKNHSDRYSALKDFMLQNDLVWPIVLKPDIGERGMGVSVVRNEQEAMDYLQQCPDEVIAQQYIGGEEFGIYYVRMPDEKRGRLFSVSQKHPQHVIGDGDKNLEHLILEDPRAVAMARFYMKKFADRLDEVPAKGEKITLVEIGTHARGAVFTDDRDLITPELTDAIDQLTRSAGALHCGRYDIKVPSADDLRAGKNIRILEFNGVTAEPAHVYQPGYPLFRGLRDLCTQWYFAFKAGSLNRARGYSPTPLSEVCCIARSHREKDWFDVDG